MCVCVCEGGERGKIGGIEWRMKRRVKDVNQSLTYSKAQRQW